MIGTGRRHQQGDASDQEKEKQGIEGQDDGDAPRPGDWWSQLGVGRLEAVIFDGGLRIAEYDSGAGGQIVETLGSAGDKHEDQRNDPERLLDERPDGRPPEWEVLLRFGTDDPDVALAVSEGATIPGDHKGFVAQDDQQDRREDCHPAARTILKNNASEEAADHEQRQANRRVDA